MITYVVRLGLLFLLLSAPAFAVIETYTFSDPVLEVRYHALSAELRCPKCQNQNIADSNAPIAQDLRKLLHQQLEQGASDDEILDYMVARYGEFVRYRPRFSGATLSLWFAPLILLLLALVVAVRTVRAQSASARTSASTVADGHSALDQSERERLQKMLSDSKEPGR
ncbi:MAG: cytochrome c-type biogenesis protein [Halioglobus sp.]